MKDGRSGSTLLGVLLFLPLVRLDVYLRPKVQEPVKSKQASKKLTLAFFVMLIGTTAVSIVVFTNYTTGSAEFKDQARSTTGMTAAEAVAVMGKPFRTLTGAEYTSEFRSGFVRSYEPDPPRVDADIVLAYHYSISMALLFIKDGVVVDVYYGET